MNKQSNLSLPFLCHIKWIALCFALLNCTTVQAASVIEQELASLKERAILAPIETLEQLNRLKANHPQLSPHEQGLLYERLSYTKIYTADYEGALRDAKELEVLGKEQHDASVECLGVLSQAYPYSMVDKLRNSEDQFRRAQDCASKVVDPTLKIKVLLAQAEIERMAGQDDASSLTLDKAQKISESIQNDALLFATIYRKVSLAGRYNKIPLALTLTDQLIKQAQKSKYPERLIRARLTEYWVSTGAGLSSRAEDAIREAIQLLRQEKLHESLGGTLVDYANFLLLAKRYKEAETTANEALLAASAIGDRSTSNHAHFSHANALIFLGRIKEGKDEVNKLLQSPTENSELQALLPDYISALSQAGDTEASLQAIAIQERMKNDADFGLSKEKAAAFDKIDTLAKLSEAKEAEAMNERQLRNLWLAVAIATAVVMTTLIALYRRLRASNGLLQQTNQQLYIASTCDALTGLANRRYLEDHVANLAQQLPKKSELGHGRTGLLLLMDLDYFKKVNDTYGHAAGDVVLQETAKRLAALFRNEDKVARWGGEEFLAILPNADPGDACKIASRILNAVASEPIVVSDIPLNVTISIGFCSHGLRAQDKELDWQQVVNLADQGLYLAKKNGRNMAYGITEAENVWANELEEGIEKLILAEKLIPFTVPGPTVISRALAQSA